jgi:hypothetical protein
MNSATTHAKIKILSNAHVVKTQTCALEEP